MSLGTVRLWSLAAVVLAALAFGRPVCAETNIVDYSAGAIFRNDPSLYWLWSEAGYGQTLWGEPSAGDYMYGYVRPWVNLGTIAVVHEAVAGLDVYPVSFAGLRLAKHRTFRNWDNAAFDCDRYACRGTLDRAELSGELTLGAAGYFMMGTFRRDILVPSVRNRPFVDDANVLPGEAGGDIVGSRQVVAGYRLADQSTIGVLGMQSRMVGTSTQADGRYLMASVNRDKWNLMGAVGRYSSSVKSPRFSMLLMLSWRPTATLRIQ